MKSPVEGKIESITSAYKAGADKFGGKFLAVKIRGEDGRLYSLGYVVPKDSDGRDIVKPGDKVAAGQIVGSMQDRAKEVKSGLMKNHLHLAIYDKAGREVDPTPLFREWTRPSREAN